MDTRLRNALLILLLAIFSSHCQQLVCYSKSLLQSQTIYSFFYGITNGFFLDIYPEHPIRDSSTIYLQSLSWNGINILQNNQTLKQFSNTRTLNLNKQIKMLAQSIEKLPNYGPQQQSLSQICESIIYKKPHFMTIPLNLLHRSLLSPFWNIQSCKPQFLLVKQYESVKIDPTAIVKMKQYGYEQINSYENFVIFVQSRLVNLFQARQKINTKIINQKPLIPFNKIAIELGSKIMNKNVTIDQLNGNMLSNKISVSIAKQFSVIDLTQQSQLLIVPKYFLIMQLNSHSTHLILPKQSIKYQSLTLANNQKYFHITYKPQNKKEYHYYIFNHEFKSQGTDGNDFIFGLKKASNGVEMARFQGEQIKEYKLEDVDKFGEETKNKDKTALQEQEKQLIRQKEYALKQLQKIKQQYALKQRERQIRQQGKQTSSQKSTQTSLQKQQKQKQKQKQKASVDLVNPEINQKVQKLTPKQPQSHISYLTPQSIFADKNVKNTTIMIVILVCSIMGSIIITALITACIMKRRHRKQVRQRIRHNAEIHQATDMQQQSKSQNGQLQLKSQHQ